MNVAHLSILGFCERIENLWAAKNLEAQRLGWDQQKLFFKCLEGTRKVDRCFGKRRVQQRKERIDRLQHCLASAQLALEGNPESLRLQQAVAEARVALEAFDKAKADWVDQILQEKWLTEGDRGTKMFHKSFKGLSSAKQIPALVDENGNAVTDWTDMASVSIDFFKKVLGPSEPADLSVPFSDPILDILTDKLTQEEKLSLNAPLSLAELEAIARCIKKGKCPGPDGVPVEFFQSMWHLVGPLLLHTTATGIEREQFPTDLTLGFVVLLPKTNDQTLLSNKRPITLLNVAYKIAAKAFQLRLTPVMQRLISPQQFAFLPGRNIHHSLLMLGEMLQQAVSSGEEYVLLKLDVIKAFDSLEWPFLLAVIERMGMEGILSKFLKAGFASASSSIILNGIPTERFLITRSVRQGCPLSPLLFILAFDLLSLHLLQVLERETIKGVYFPEARVKTSHNFYADDVYVVIRATMRYIQEFKNILFKFGRASGLCFAWEATIASCIPAGPPPRDLSPLPWRWEDMVLPLDYLGLLLPKASCRNNWNPLCWRRSRVVFTNSKREVSLWRPG